MGQIAVTGVGCISSLGRAFPEFSERLLSGHCGIGPITLFDASSCVIQRAAEVPGYDELAHFDRSKCAQTDRFAQFAILSAREAVADAGLDFSGPLSERAAVVFGTGVGGHTALDASYRRLYAEKAKRLHPFTVPKLMFSSAVSHVSMDLGIRGPAFTTASACASSAHAIAMAAMMLRSGLADVVVTGGAEACITLGTMKGWERLRVMAPDTCRPFSRSRGGMMIGEGAATLVLENPEHARKRGARIHAELAGVGMSSDAAHLIQPSVEGAVRAMSAALADAGLEPARVDYLNAHGTGTEQNDRTETAAIHRVFGEHARRLAVSSSKSQFGHLMGGGSALEALATIVALKAQIAPPTLGYLGPDPECDLDCVPNQSRPMKIERALSNSFAFGGLNVSLAFRRPEGADRNGKPR